MKNANLLFEFEKALRIDFDNRYLYCIDKGVDIYDKSLNLIGTLKGLPNPNYIKSLDETTVIVKNTSGKFGIYDLISMQPVKIFKPIRINQPQDSMFFITPDKKYLVDFVYFFPNSKLLIYNLKNGESSLYELGDNIVGRDIFHDDVLNKLYLLTSSCDESQNYPICIYETPISLTFNKPKIIKTIYNHSFIHSGYHTGKIYFSDDKLHFYNLYTDEFSNSIDDKTNSGNFTCIKCSENGKLIGCVDIINSLVSVYDIEQKTCIEKIKVKSPLSLNFYDNSKLLIGTMNGGYCVGLNGIDMNK